jgi:hypothetical protein
LPYHYGQGVFDYWEEGSEELGDVMMMEDGALYKGAALICFYKLEEVGWISWGLRT